jgi:hypothetical protein
MSNEKIRWVGQTITQDATANITKHRFVGFTGQHAGANAKALGASLTYDTPNGSALAVAISGIVILEAGGEITAGAAVTSDANGKAVAVAAVTVTVPVGGTEVTSDGAQPTLVVAGGRLPVAINGYALEASSGDGKFIQVRLV